MNFTFVKIATLNAEIKQNTGIGELISLFVKFAQKIARFQKLKNAIQNTNRQPRKSICIMIKANNMTDEQYIKDLEGMVHYLAKLYLKNKATYYDAHFKIRSVGNPNRRELTEQEESEWSRFATVQSFVLRGIVDKFGKVEKSNPSDVTECLRRYLGE